MQYIPRYIKSQPDNKYRKDPSTFLNKRAWEDEIIGEIKIKNLIQNYQKVELYFDNDNAGNRAIEMIKNAGENIEDCRILYKNHKDLNEFLMSWEMRKRDTGVNTRPE